MAKRFISIWFSSLRTDWFSNRDHSLRNVAFVLSIPDHGRMIITAVNQAAAGQGIEHGMSVADARAIHPTLVVKDDDPSLSQKILTNIARWCVRFSPLVSIDLPDGLLMDVSGCSHLWGGDEKYIKAIEERLSAFNYHLSVCIADTIGSAWAIARFGRSLKVIAAGDHTSAILTLPPQSLRLEKGTIERLHKLGLKTIAHFISMPRSALRRRFSAELVKRLDQALGKEVEILLPVDPIELFQERLPCLEPIAHLAGIEIALKELLKKLCARLQAEEKGLRICHFKCYRVDNKTQTISIGTHRPSNNPGHLFKLFEIKLGTIEPDLGIELFTLDALNIEEHSFVQANLWEKENRPGNNEIAELIDRLSAKMGAGKIHRYLPDEHYWPERSIRQAKTIDEQKTTEWKIIPRPVQLLTRPEPIEVTAPVPDYPPMNFRYQKKLHKIIKADGPERIEQEWWLQEGLHRDYYHVEDEEGKRYWLFRLGHYSGDKGQQWFIHGFFA